MNDEVGRIITAAIIAIVPTVFYLAHKRIHRTNYGAPSPETVEVHTTGDQAITRNGHHIGKLLWNNKWFAPASCSITIYDKLYKLNFAKLNGNKSLQDAGNNTIIKIGYEHPWAFTWAQKVQCVSDIRNNVKYLINPVSGSNDRELVLADQRLARITHQPKTRSGQLKRHRQIQFASKPSEELVLVAVFASLCNQDQLNSI